MYVYAIGLVSLYLWLFVSCSSPQVYKRVQPPEMLLQDCEYPVLRDTCNAALVELALEQRAALENCTADKKALRQWARDVR